MTPPQHLTRYRDVRAALLDSRLVIHKPIAVGSPCRHITEAPHTSSRSHRMEPLWHVLSEQLAARNVAPQSDLVATFVSGVLSSAVHRGHMEVVHDLAFPLPMAVMLDLLGLPAQHTAPLAPLFGAITAGHDMGATERDRHQAQLAQLTLGRWLSPLLQRRRSTPLMDAISAVVDAQKIDTSTFTYWCVMLLYAGSATTRDFLTNAIGALLESPEACAQFVEHPAMADSAVEELLRFVGPVRGLGRVATDDVRIGAHDITRGELVYLMLADANRDPERFAAPDSLDLQRSPNPHLAFGLGATYCLGSHLARLESRIVLDLLRPLLMRMSTPHPARWSGVRLLRSRTSLEITIGHR